MQELLTQAVQPPSTGHGTASSSTPGQYVPLCFGTGVSQLLVLTCSPDWASHTPTVQADQPPSTLHGTESVLIPSQSSPPFSGAGSLHCLFLDWVPLSGEQLPAFCHSPQFPLTTYVRVGSLPHTKKCAML